MDSALVNAEVCTGNGINQCVLSSLDDLISDTLLCFPFLSVQFLSAVGSAVGALFTSLSCLAICLYSSWTFTVIVIVAYVTVLIVWRLITYTGWRFDYLCTALHCPLKTVH